MRVNFLRRFSPVVRYPLSGLIVLIAASTSLTIANYPRTVDNLTPEDLSTARKDYRAFYEDSYSTADNTVDAKIEKSYNERGGPEVVRPEDDVHLIPVKDFVQRYGVSNRRVLEIGAGPGRLQDVVDNYTALDISSSARRFYHKPLVVGS